MSDELRMFIPADRLPPGFAERLDSPAAPQVEPRPASTVVLLRPPARPGTPEVLLLQRNRTAGFVPGAWVFPGGRVDDADADDALWRNASPPAEPPAPYWTAAVRELFEETGVLLARREGAYAPDASDPQVAEWREALLADRATLRDVLEALALTLDVAPLVFCAHWVTPVAEHRRYDTRFFLAPLPAGREVRPDPREMRDAVWLSARDALERHRAGDLPMVFPTVRTLESLLPFDTAEAALEAFRGRSVPRVLPRLVRTQGGVALVVDHADATNAGGS